jgi:hypothetical protein
MVLLTACGGGGGGGGGNQVTTSATPSGANVHPITVNGGPGNNVNLAMTSVEVCVAGSSTQCVTIDNILVDTGSVGLRVLSSALTALPLQQQLSASGNPLLECVQFVDSSHAWGPVKIADVKLGAKTASAARIQLIGTPAGITEPTACSGGDANSNVDTVAKLGANGVLGIGHFTEDCGVVCTYNAANPLYYACPGSTCTSTIAALGSQVQNPVAHFSSDNNGVIIQLPAVAAAGAASISGWLIFGIDTQSNNALGSAKMFTLDNSGYVGTTYKSSNYPQSFVDSGSNGLYFPDSSIPTCTFSSDFYCPTSTLNLSATIIGANSVSSAINFSVGDAGSLASSVHVFGNLAGHYAGGFDWGLPFFFGRKVYTAFENNAAGPYVAF